MLDRQLLKYLLPQDSWAQGVGIYGAVYKISIFLVLFNQAFRYAAEPFFFKNANLGDGKENGESHGRFCLGDVCGFVLIIAGLDYGNSLLTRSFGSFLHLVPILLLANVILGINTNLNMWYKVSDKTTYGIYITFVGYYLYGDWECCTYSSDGDSRGSYHNVFCVYRHVFRQFDLGKPQLQGALQLSKIGGLVVVSSGLAFAPSLFSIERCLS